MYFLLKNADNPASYVRLPEGTNWDDPPSTPDFAGVQVSA